MAGAQELNAQLGQRPLPEGHFGEWRAELEGVNAEFPLSYPQRDDVIMPQWAIEVGRHPFKFFSSEYLWEGVRSGCLKSAGLWAVSNTVTK